jgi:hypothetical protein
MQYVIFYSNCHVSHRNSMFSCSLREREREREREYVATSFQLQPQTDIQLPGSNIHVPMKKKEEEKEFNNYMPGTKGITPGNYELMVKSWIQANKSKRVAS